MFCGALMDEMEGVDPDCWLPEHTLHVFVDPMLRALGWDHSDPAECRPHCSGAPLAGYSLSAESALAGPDAPDSVALAAPLGTSLGESAACVWSDSETVLAGVVALTNGIDWEVHYRGSLIVKLDVMRKNRDSAARILTEWLGKSAFVGTF